jgi:hypothetical protein
MGLQCSIIITYISDNYTEAGQIASILNVPNLESSVDAAGDRGWEPNNSLFHTISMKSWGFNECQHFFNQLRQYVKWDYPHSVQLYWQPSDHRHYVSFNYEPLFPDIFRDSQLIS